MELHALWMSNNEFSVCFYTRSTVLVSRQAEEQMIKRRPLWVSSAIVEQYLHTMDAGKSDAVQLTEASNRYLGKCLLQNQRRRQPHPQMYALTNNRGQNNERSNNWRQGMKDEWRRADGCYNNQQQQEKCSFHRQQHFWFSTTANLISLITFLVEYNSKTLQIWIKNTNAEKYTFINDVFVPVLFTYHTHIIYTEKIYMY